MSKINIKSVLNNLTEDEKFNVEEAGIKIDNKIKYIDDFVTVIIELKDDKVFLERTAKEYYIKMEFDINNITNGTYEINALGSLDLRVETKKLDVESDRIFIKYTMYINDVKQDFEYEIIYKERDL